MEHNKQNKHNQLEQFGERNYIIAEFKDGSVQLIPQKWGRKVDNKLKCKYPVHMTKDKDFKQAVKKMIDSQFSWKIVDIVKIIGSSDSYDRGMEKLKEVVQYNLSSVTTDDGLTQKKNRQFRAKKKFNKCNVQSSNEESSDNSDSSITSKNVPCVKKSIPAYPKCSSKHEVQNCNKPDNKKRTFPVNFENKSRPIDPQYINNEGISFSSTSSSPKKLKSPSKSQVSNYNNVPSPVLLNVCEQGISTKYNTQNTQDDVFTQLTPNHDVTLETPTKFQYSNTDGSFNLFSPNTKQNSSSKLQISGRGCRLLFSPSLTSQKIDGDKKWQRGDKNYTPTMTPSPKKQKIAVIHSQTLIPESNQVQFSTVVKKQNTQEEVDTQLT